MQARSWEERSSPFVFDGPLPPNAVVGREAEIAFLTDAALHGRTVSLIGPRRYGKTSLFGRVIRDLRRDHDVAAVLVDCYGTVSLADLTVRIERAYSKHLTGPIRRQVERVLRAGGLGLSLGTAGFAVTPQRHPQTDPLPALHALLDLPDRLGGGRVYVVLDEFQDVMAIGQAEAILRSHLQHQRDRAAYAFAGSEPGLMDALFADQRRPFFRQADVRRLEPLPDGPLGDAIDDAFARTERAPGDVLDALLRTVRGHPQRAMLLAHLLWNATPPGEIADEKAWEQALDAALARTAREAEARYQGRTLNQQRTLRAVASRGEPFALPSRAYLGLARGSVAKAVEQLLSAGEIERLGPGEYRVVDPLFEVWLQRLGGLAQPDDEPRS